MHSLKKTILASVLLFGMAANASPKLSSTPDLESDIVEANAWIEIDAGAFKHNLEQIQGMIGDSSICAVMKADAYGHGIALLMPTIAELNIPCVGVTSNEELRVVRDSGYEGSLVRIRLATPEEIEGALEYQVEELIGSKSLGDKASEIAKKHQRKLPIHLALNSSGMSRNGLDLSTDEGKKAALAIAKDPNFEIVGIMTHYSVGEEKAVLEALQRFNEEANWIIQEGKLDRNKVKLHTANTYATTEIPATHLDLVRPGRVLYGDMGGDPKYQRVLHAFKTKVASVNPYPKGAKVSYDGTYTLERDSVLANIPVGYSDGYRRVLSNKGHVLINGERAPIVGNITMNTFMVDVTDLKTPVSPGDEVVLFGKQGTTEITQEELEEITGEFLANMYTVWSHSNYKKLKQSDQAIEIL